MAGETGMISKTKTIKMLLYDGSLNGVTNISDSAWESGKMYSAPRESINDLVSRADCKKYGVYLLLSEHQVYVGQAIDLERRTKQHLTDKEWWNQVILMTTKDDSFTASDIDYLEARLISIAAKAGTSDSENKKKGNPQKVDEFRQAELEQYLDEALFLLEIIGIRVFKKTVHKLSKTAKPPIDLKETNSMKEVKQSGQNKPQLPDESLKPGVYVKTAMKTLLDSGFEFTEEQIKIFSTVEGSYPYTTRHLPMLFLLKDGESHSTCDPAIRHRYWKEEYISGAHRFLMYSQWYGDGGNGATKKHFIDWYNTL